MSYLAQIEVAFEFRLVFLFLKATKEALAEFKKQSGRKNLT
jgi:hypothetical protein